MFFSVIDALSAGEFRDVQCDTHQVGRFLAIRLNNPGYLTICEFEVYGGKIYDLACDKTVSDI